MTARSPASTSPAPASDDAPVTAVPLLDLRAQYRRLRDRIMPAIDEVMDSQQFINGPAVAELENDIADYCGARFAVGVSSGTDALICAMMAMGIGPGDEVITTPFTFFATVGSIWRVGATPVFADIDPETFNLDPARIEPTITERTRAIVPVHLFGQMAAMGPVLGSASKHGLGVIEDAAQAIGAAQHGAKAGTLGHAGAFSFFPTKNLGGAGDGGMIVTDDPDLARALVRYRGHGASPEDRYHHDQVGGNFRLDTLQAAYLRLKLAHLDQWSAARRANAARYAELLEGVGDLVLPTVAEGNVSVFNQYTIRTAHRDALRDHLAGAHVGSAVYYPRCLHEQRCFERLGYRRGAFPRAEQAADQVLSLPIYPELSDAQLVYVADAIGSFFDP